MIRKPDRNVFYYLLFIVVASCIVPVSAADVTIDPTDKIKDAINSADPGDTIILNSGTYSEYNIPVTKTIALRANTSAGGNRSNTIIDAGGNGRIFDVSGGSTVFTLEGLALLNGQAPAASHGGAIYHHGSGTVNVTASNFTSCQAGTGSGKGGAISSSGTLIVNTSVFYRCRAGGGKGGAIHFAGGIHPLTVSSSYFRYNTASSGSAIYIDDSQDTLLKYNWFHPDTAGLDAVYVSGGSTVTAENNWWGQNHNIDGFYIISSGTLDVDPWLVLGATADPTSITTGDRSTVKANLTFNSDGTNTSVGGLYVPDGIAVDFAVVTDSGFASGSVSPAAPVTANGVAVTTFTPSAAGTANISVSSDEQWVYTEILVTLQADPTPPGGGTSSGSSSVPGDAGDSCNMTTRRETITRVKAGRDRGIFVLTVYHGMLPVRDYPGGYHPVQGSWRD